MKERVLGMFITILFGGPLKYKVLKAVSLLGILLAWIALWRYNWRDVLFVPLVLVGFLYFPTLGIQFHRKPNILFFIISVTFILFGLNYSLAGVVTSIHIVTSIGMVYLTGGLATLVPSIVLIPYPWILHSSSYVMGLAFLVLGVVIVSIGLMGLYPESEPESEHVKFYVQFYFEPLVYALFTAGALSIAGGIHSAAQAPRFELAEIDVHGLQPQQGGSTATLYRFLLYFKNAGMRVARNAVAKLILSLEESKKGGIGRLVIAEKQGFAWLKCRKNGVDCPLRRNGICSTTYLSPPVKVINEYLPWVSAIPKPGINGIAYYHVNTLVPGTSEAVGVFEIWRLQKADVIIRFYSEQGIESPKRQPQPRICLLVDKFPTRINFKVSTYGDNALPLLVDCTLTVDRNQADLKCYEDREFGKAEYITVPLT